MPHLSPLQWISLPILFWLSLLIIMSCFWWFQSPKLISFQKSMKSMTSRPWSWT